MTQTGGGDLLLRFASSVQSCCGEGGRCRQTSLCVGSTRRVPDTRGLPRTGVSVLSPSVLLRLPAALYGAGPALSAVPVFGSSTKAWTRLRLRVLSSPPQRFRQPKACARSPGCNVPFPSAASGSGSQRFGALSPDAARLFPPRPQRAPPVGSQEVFRQEPGPVCRVDRKSTRLNSSHEQAAHAGEAKGKGALHPGRGRPSLWPPGPLAPEGKGARIPGE